MKKRTLARFAAAAALALGVCACSAGQTQGTADAAASAKQAVEAMTTEQKLAQLIVIPLRSDPANTHCAQEITKDYSDVLTKYDFGGVILFADNMSDVDQTVTFINDCQSAAAASEKGIPLFVAVDEEGGVVNRVPFGVTGPGNMALTATGDASLVSESATLLGSEAKALGFNMDFAPVSDVNNNPNNPIIGVRSFSDDPQVVADNVVKYNQAMQETGIATALKHFPGHGNVSTDSHTGLPLSELTLSELESCELVPFAAGIKSGADMIMTAHIQFPAIDSTTYTSKKDGQSVYLPATLSREIITGILREKMGFDGVITTDALEMDAIADHFDRFDAATMAINAGVDILLCPVSLYVGDGIDTRADIDAYMKGLADRVASGDIDEARLNESVARILKLKIERGIISDTEAPSTDKQIEQAKATVGTAEHLDRDWEMAQQSMTLLKNDGAALPLDGNNGSHTLILYPSDMRKATVEYAVARLQKEGRLAEGATTALCYKELAFDDAQLQQALADAQQVMILSQAAERNEVMGQVIAQAHQDGKKVVLLSLGVPYDAACYSDADAVLCAFQPYGSAHDSAGNGPFNLNVAVALCDAFGTAVPQGTLPVNIPRFVEGGESPTFSTSELLYERGSGLKNWGA